MNESEFVIFEKNLNVINILTQVSNKLNAKEVMIIFPIKSFVKLTC